MREALTGEFLAWLGGERRAAPKTLETYGRDILVFLEFCETHIGEAVSLETLKTLRLADVRAWMAAEHGARLPVVESTLEEYGHLIAEGFGDEDISSIYRLKSALFTNFQPKKT